jgi:hypothetical protein
MVGLIIIREISEIITGYTVSAPLKSDRTSFISKMSNTSLSMTVKEHMGTPSWTYSSKANRCQSRMVAFSIFLSHLNVSMSRRAARHIWMTP